MRKISKGLAVVAAVMAVGGVSLVAVAQTGGPGYGPMGYGASGSGGYGPMGYGHMGYGPMGYGSMGSMLGQGGYGMMGGWGGQGGAGFVDPSARLDALKAELAIRPEQTTAWDAYAKAVRDSATEMQAIRGSIDFDKLRAMPWQEHQTYMGQLHDRRAAAFRSVQAAATTLMAALDDAQKARLLSASQGYSGPGRMGGYGGSATMGPGYGMMGWGPGGTR